MSRSEGVLQANFSCHLECLHFLPSTQKRLRDAHITCWVAVDVPPPEKENTLNEFQVMGRFEWGTGIQATREPRNSWDSPYQGYSSSLGNGKAIETRHVQSCAQAEMSGGRLIRWVFSSEITFPYHLPSHLFFLTQNSLHACSAPGLEETNNQTLSLYLRGSQARTGKCVWEIHNTGEGCSFYCRWRGRV